MKITAPISLGLFHVWAQGAEAAGGFLALPMTRQTPSQTLARRQTAVSLPATDRDGYLIDGTILGPFSPSTSRSNALYPDSRHWYAETTSAALC
jgi:hypothetical protein